MALVDKFLYPNASKASDRQLDQRILQHLNHLLNARREIGSRGIDSTLPSFGLSDYREQQLTPAFLQTLIQEMIETVQYYEPRLQHVDIRLGTYGHPPRQCFYIEGMINQQSYRFRCIPDPAASRQLSPLNST